MDKKIIYYVGCVVLFLALLWMFLPHAFHGSVETAVGASEESLPSHLVDILMGLVGVVLGLILITVGNKKERL